MVRPGFATTTAVLVAAAIAQAVLIVRWFDRTRAELARFLAALAAGEPTSVQPRGAGALGRTFAEVSARFGDRLHEATRERAYHAALIVNVPIPLLAVTDDRVTLLNSAARRLLVGGAVRRVDLAPLGEGFARDLDAVGPGERRITTLEVDGVTRRYVMTVSEVVAAGEVTRLVALQDIQGELDAAAFQAWDRMVRVLAHEIMGSLTPVASLTTTAAELVDAASRELPGGASLTDARDALTTAARRCESLMEFVTRYRRFSALPPPQRRRVGLAALFAGVRDLFARELATAGVTVTIAVDPHDLDADADPTLLEQAVINLVKNAIDALGAADGGELSLGARLTREGRVLIEVADRGPGIPPEVADQLFTPFFTTKRGGSGIGLSLVQQIALAHGGAAWCADRPGGGAVFALLL